MPELHALNAELQRIARIATSLTGGPCVLVHASTAGGFLVHGDDGAAKALSGDEQLLGELMDRHSRGTVAILRSGGDEHAGALGRLAELLTPATGSIISLPVRNEAGGLVGCLVVRSGDPEGVDEQIAAALTDLASLAARCIESLGRIDQAALLEKTVQVQTAYLDRLFEDAPEAIAILDDRHRIVKVNREYTLLYGYTAEEAIGRSPAELTVPEDQVDKAREMGRRAALGEYVRGEVIRRRKDGTEVPVAIHCIPVRISREQLGVYTITRDLSAEVAAVQALERREQRFRALIENATDVVAVLTAGGMFDYVTPSVESVLGIEPSELIGTSAFGLLHPDDAPDAIARFTAVLSGECRGKYDIRIQGTEGRWRTFEVRARSFVGDPELKGVIVNARDVTDERAAKQMQRRLDAFLEATPDFVAVFDPHGRALAINHAFRSALNIDDSDPDALERVTLEDLFPRETMERLLHEGIPFAAREGSWSGETSIRTHGGEDIPISQVVLSHRSPSGRLEFLSTLARDITAQKEAESALRRSEAHFRSLIENALDVITIVDEGGTIQFVSPSVQRVLGYEPDALIGTNVFSLIHREDVPTAAEAFNKVRAGRRQPNETTELRILHRSGSWKRLESASENLLENPAVGGIVINSRDVTDRRFAEEALMESQEQLLQSQKMEAVGRLAGGIAHDFNNLLTAIKGFTELLLLDFDERDPRRAFASEIQGAATRAAGLTRQLLAFSRRQVLQPKVLDLNTTVTEMERMLGRMIGEDLKMVCALAGEPAPVKADPAQIEQVLMNLVVNARDAMPAGGELRIRTDNVILESADPKRPSYVKPGRYTLLEVSDTGSGMSREVQDRVFEPFFTTKAEGKGTGLGLSTVYGIVKQSEGYVFVDSTLGEGTTFRIYLPRAEEDALERPVESAAAEMLEGTETILVVEDEGAVRALVRRVLERSGYRVLDAPGGAEALLLLEAEGIVPDLLLTDVVMPGMSGRELALELEERLPGLRVLYMSGYTDEAIVNHGVLTPGVEFLQKPFTPDALLRRVRQVIGGSSTDCS